MPFGDYKTLGEAIRALQVTEIMEGFVEPVSIPVNDYFRCKVAGRLRNHPVNCSEWAVCESLLFPILEEVGQHYAQYVNMSRSFRETRSWARPITSSLSGLPFPFR